MARFHIPAGRWVVVSPSDWEHERLVLAGEDHHHLVRVLQLRNGNVIGVLNGVGGVACGELADVTKQSASVILRERKVVPAARPGLHICQALLRESAMDRVVASAVELGARRLTVFQADRSVVKCVSKKAESRVARWRRVAVNAARQCGQPWLPEIEGIGTLEDALSRVEESDARWWASLSPEAVLLRDRVRRDVEPPEAITVLVGPEGDFSPAEEARLRAKGLEPVSLGSGVLRAETAALFVMSALRYEFGL